MKNNVITKEMDTIVGLLFIVNKLKKRRVSYEEKN